MMRRIKNYSKLVLAVGLVLSTSLLWAADTTWIGDIAGSTATLAAGENLNITGDCYFSSGSNAVIDVLGTGAHTVNLSGTGTVRTITSGMGGRLLIHVVNGAALTFDLTDNHDLYFSGGSGSNLFDIIQTDDGIVNFMLKGGRIVRLRGGANGVDEISGTRYFCALAHDGHTPQVGVNIEYDRATDSNSNAVFSLEDNSMFSFIALDPISTSTEVGGIGICPAEDLLYSGSLVLNIQDRAGFILTGHQYSGTTVDLATLAGHHVNFVLRNDWSATPMSEPRITRDGGDYRYRLLVINGNKILSQLFSDPTRTRVTPTGVQHGFILGPNSLMRLTDGTYLDYVGTTTNTDPLDSATNVLQGRTATSILKARNSSALTVDGTDLTGSHTTRIILQDESAIFLRSACDASGTWTYAPYALTDVGLIFTITPTWQPLGAGNIVFEVEAALDVLAQAVETAASLGVINVLSREVAQTGGKVEMEGTYTTFPAFTFAYDDHDTDTLAQYAKACMFINSRVNLNNVILRHDDFFHVVNSTNTPIASDPTYIGGDTFKLIYSDVRPTINLFNSELRLHTSAAFTGVDLLTTTTLVDTDCTSTFRFYGNGRVLDRGTGRALVLGTVKGSYAYDEATVVDSSSYCDVYQQYAATAGTLIDLQLTTTHNDHNWISQIAVGADLSTQNSIHTLFLGNASNIQIGSQTTQSGVTLTLYPELNVRGNFFSFMSQGGSIGQPELSATTGEGGIFVDQNGTISLDSSIRSNFSCMVVKGSPTATITLPKSRAFFNDRVGIAYWDLDLSLTQTIVSSGQNLSDFTIDWMAAKKDYTGGFIPFDPNGDVATSLSYANMYHIPVIGGQVDELHVKRSRLGDQFHLLVNGGKIRDLEFLSGFDSAEAQTGIVIVENDGQVGLGNNETRRDAREACVVLGINGLTLAADGNGIFNINTDITINNNCPILAGPDFGITSTQALYLRSDDPHFIRVKNGGSLDLSSFNTANKQIIFDGKVQLIFEPGAELVLSDNATAGGSLIFMGQSQLLFENLIDNYLTTPSTVADTNDFRAKLRGTGQIIFNQDSSCMIPKDAYVGIESNATAGTGLYFQINDNAKFQIGTANMPGGALQIGNTADYDTTVTVSFELHGTNALFEIGPQGFLGFGAGIVDKRESVPNNWYIGPLYNVANINLIGVEGTVKFNNIYAGSSAQAGLIALGVDTDTMYTMSGAASANVLVLGGGNLYRLTASTAKQSPTVLNTASANVGILASSILVADYANAANLAVFTTSGDVSDLFEAARTKDVWAMYSPRANFAHGARESDYVGYLNGTTIKRETVQVVLNRQGIPVPHSFALGVGAVSINIDSSTGGINNAIEVSNIAPVILS